MTEEAFQNRRLRLIVTETVPPFSIDPKKGYLIYAEEGQTIRIKCEILAENLGDTILSIDYNPSFFDILNSNSEVHLGSGNFTMDYEWSLLALRESSGFMELQITSTDQNITRKSDLRVLTDRKNKA